ncbi:transcriptional regulator GcvA [Sneathiella sp. P13V-1]|uniref:transcriptional regulator GcvA n=1 Tax=Sneathiella sp. P13V-1 TaxID=2697366 RepID=UPI001D111694|nr:transcriptional regulator GcvA [Sneathiella sp. P13V-1]
MKLPPLNSLRAFEAAARHLSFSKAAEELYVTPAAVSHQIKGLEEWLGIQLFRRLNRSVILTDVGQTYLKSVRDGLETLSDGTERILNREAGGALTVSTLPSFAARWLLPRLSRFREKYPDMDVRLSASDHLTDFAREDVDLVIRYGHGNYPDLHSELLLNEDSLFPVCSPALLKGARPLEKPEDLVHHTLLHDDMRVDWEMWLAAANVSGVDSKKGLTFNDSSMLLMAAMEGQGVALGRSTLAEQDLAAGRLVKLFDMELKGHHAYYIIFPPERINDPNIQVFREWLFEEAQINPGRFMSTPD